MAEKEIGKIKHYFDKISVGIVELTDELEKGDQLHIKGHTTDFEVTANSIHIYENEVEEAKAGDSVGIKVPEHVREGDRVYKVED